MTRPAPDLGPPPRRLTLPEEDEYQLFELLQRLRGRWRLLGATTLGAGALFVALALIRPPGYTAQTSFTPEIGTQRRLPGSLAGLAGLAGQFGLSLGGDAQSPRFYANVIRSRTLRERLVLSRFTDPRPDAAPGDSATLLELLKVKGKTRADSLYRGVRRLRRLLEIEIDNQTRVVNVEVSTRYPDLSAAVANRVVEYLNEFNAETRQSQARERRRFVEDRITQVERTLRDAEDRLRRFYDTNHLWRQSPEMTFEEGRLRRQVDIAQELYVSLRREHESARIEEVNDTPVLTVIDAAIPPTRRSSPRRRVALAVGLMLGFMGGVVWVLGTDYWRRASQK